MSSEDCRSSSTTSSGNIDQTRKTSGRRMSHFKEYKFFRSFSAKVENWPMRKAETLWRRMRERKIAEIEAQEACKWLRAAGFPQYAQMYEESLVAILQVMQQYDMLVLQRIGGHVAPGHGRRRSSNERHVGRRGGSGRRAQEPRKNSSTVSVGTESIRNYKHFVQYSALRTTTGSGQLTRGIPRNRFVCTKIARASSRGNGHDSQNRGVSEARAALSAFLLSEPAFGTAPNIGAFLLLPLCLHLVVFLFLPSLSSAEEHNRPRLWVRQTIRLLPRIRHSCGYSGCLR
ncbi:Rho GTPase-activating protein 7 [Cyphomyrmex costatus]|uniref:Rho GTPase-activating protein 7 n=1 Tax=Cyphomyrmex costatus TaxID=456900 RepID=A0A195C887_9HYME|nr:Rho GTPase-activating protein 7 [Cyphomyrmex costatus]